MDRSSHQFIEHTAAFHALSRNLSQLQLLWGDVSALVSRTLAADAAQHVYFFLAAIVPGVFCVVVGLRSRGLKGNYQKWRDELWEPF